MLPKTSTYLKSYDGQTKWMYFFWLKMMTWDKVSTDIIKDFASEPAYNKNILKIKVKSHDNEVKDFYNKEIPKAESNHICLAVISLDSARNKDRNCYPQVFLKECKCIKKKVIRHNIDDLESSSDDSDEEQIKAMKLMFLEKTILKMQYSETDFLREQF